MVMFYEFLTVSISDVGEVDEGKEYDHIDGTTKFGALGAPKFGRLVNAETVARYVGSASSNDSTCLAQRRQKRKSRQIANGQVHDGLKSRTVFSIYRLSRRCGTAKVQ